MRFVDTSFWVALQFSRDRHHTDAAALWRLGPGALLSTTHVIGETWTFLRRRLGHEEAQLFRRSVTGTATLAIRHVPESDEQDAWRWLERHDERPYSFVDATSFATMRKMRIAEALAFDGDFSAAGFTEIRP